MIIAIIVAVAKNNVIGMGNTIPWYCPEDLKYFKRTTLGSPILMGRKTYESLKIKPLPGRKNIVVTRDKNLSYEGCDMVANIEEGIALAEPDSTEKLFVIGGADIYQQCLPMAKELYITEVDVRVEGDRFFPLIEKSEWSLVEENVCIADENNPHDMTFKVFLRQ